MSAAIKWWGSVFAAALIVLYLDEVSVCAHAQIAAMTSLVAFCGGYLWSASQRRKGRK